MQIVSLDQLQDAIEWVSCDSTDNEAFICRQTRRIYRIAGEPGTIDEEDVPENIHDDDTFLPVPDKRDLDLRNQMVFDFAKRYMAQQYDMEPADCVHIDNSPRETDADVVVLARSLEDLVER